MRFVITVFLGVGVDLSGLSLVTVVSRFTAKLESCYVNKPRFFLVARTKHAFYVNRVNNLCTRKGVG